SEKWAGIALGPDGKLYCAPYRAPDVLVIDPATGTAERTDFGLNLSGAGKWRGIALGPDGRLYCCPSFSRSVLIIEDFSPPPTPGLYLKDPISDEYYSLPGGQISKQMDFG